VSRRHSQADSRARTYTLVAARVRRRRLNRRTAPRPAPARVQYWKPQVRSRGQRATVAVDLHVYRSESSGCESPVLLSCAPFGNYSSGILDDPSYERGFVIAMAVLVLQWAGLAFSPNSPLVFNRAAGIETTRSSPMMEAGSRWSDYGMAPVECNVDEPELECNLRKQVEGPWADEWAKYVLLRPGMTFSELKAATRQRNNLDPKQRIPGTYRTVVLTHLVCFLAAIPAVLASDAVLPKLLEAAAVSRAASGI
jgi:hypothetical protein